MKANTSKNLSDKNKIINSLNKQNIRIEFKDNSFFIKKIRCICHDRLIRIINKFYCSKNL